MFSCSPLDLEKDKMKKASNSDTRKTEYQKEFIYHEIQSDSWILVFMSTDKVILSEKKNKKKLSREAVMISMNLIILVAEMVSPQSLPGTFKS